MSRLARSCKDWQALLDVCAIYRTLLADADGLYDPSHYNDRLLLGLKGTMSEAELHILKSRLQMGMWNKAERGELEWRRPNRPTLANMLHHPIYAGAYRWGHRETDPRKKIAGRRSTGRTFKSHDDCRVLIRDRFPAYITWEEFEKNQQEMAENSTIGEALSAPRHGPSVLSGLIRCGRGGASMLVGYANINSTSGAKSCGTPACAMQLITASIPVNDVSRRSSVGGSIAARRSHRECGREYGSHGSGTSLGGRLRQSSHAVAARADVRTTFQLQRTCESH